MTEHSFAAKLFHIAMIILITIYVVFVQKNNTVESVVRPNKLITPPLPFRKDHSSGHIQS